MLRIKYSCQLEKQQGLWWCTVSSNFKCANTVFESLRTTFTGAIWQTGDQTFHSGWIIGSKSSDQTLIQTLQWHTALFFFYLPENWKVLIWKENTEVVLEVKTVPLSLILLHSRPVHVGYVVDEVLLGQASQGTSFFPCQYHFLSNS